MPVVCCLLSSSPLRLSFVSVVFDFSASLNDVAPVSPFQFPVDFNQHKSVKEPFFRLCSVMCCDV